MKQPDAEISLNRSFGDSIVSRSSPYVSAIILAAGESRRMGSNKLLLPWGQTTVLKQTIAAVKASNVQDIWVITGHQADAVRDQANAAGVKTIHNIDYANGFTTSVQTAVRNLQDSSDAILVVLGDQPMIDPLVMNALLAAYAAGSSGLVAPTYQGKRGNPVIIDRRYFSELLELPPDSAPRALLQNHPDDLELVESPDEAVLHDLDLPEDYARWRPKKPAAPNSTPDKSGP